MLLGSCSVWAAPARFDGFQLFSVKIETTQQLGALKALGYSESLIFMDEPSVVGQEVEVAVAPFRIDEFNEFTESTGLQKTLLVPNLQTLLDNEIKVSSRDDGFDLANYHSVEEIYAWLDTLPALYPGVVTRIKGGETYEGRTIEGVKLSKNPSNPAIFVESNIHAREWITSASTNWIINELLTSTDPEVMALTENFNWYIFPVVNPDGYEYSRNTYRLWRKTRSRQDQDCWGVDPNRNWNFEWQLGGDGSSDDPCSDTYAGATPFSEIETRTLSEFALSIKDEIKVYLAFLSAARMILSPYGHTPLVPADHDDQMKIMEAAYERLRAVHGTEYTFGNTYTTLCKASLNGIPIVRS